MPPGKGSRTCWRPERVAARRDAQPIAEQLRTRGPDAVGVAEDAALIGTPDEDMSAHVGMQQRVLVTPNIADFATIATD